MFTQTFRISTDDLNDDVIASIKSMFGKKKEIEIVVSEALDETEYLLRSEANKKHLLKGLRDSKKIKSLVTFTSDELKLYNKKKAK